MVTVYFTDGAEHEVDAVSVFDNGWVLANIPDSGGDRMYPAFRIRRIGPSDHGLHFDRHESGGYTVITENPTPGDDVGDGRPTAPGGGGGGTGPKK